MKSTEEMLISSYFDGISTSAKYIRRVCNVFEKAGRSYISIEELRRIADQMNTTRNKYLDKPAKEEKE